MKAAWLPASRLIGLLFWISLGGLRMRATWQSGRIIPALLAAQAGLVAWLLLTRRTQAVDTSWTHNLVAWLSAVFPLMLPIQNETLLGQGLASLGLVLVLWALSSLGRSFGIAPADRGLVQNGPYRYIRHPMYLGELVSLSGALVGDPSLRNLLLIQVLLATLLLRLRWEEGVIFNYAHYAGRVPWRLLPGIW